MAEAAFDGCLIRVAPDGTPTVSGDTPADVTVRNQATGWVLDQVRMLGKAPDPIDLHEALWGTSGGATEG